MIVIKASGSSGHQEHDVEHDLPRAFRVLRASGVRVLGGGIHSDGQAFIVLARNADSARAVKLVEAAIASKKTTTLGFLSRVLVDATSSLEKVKVDLFQNAHAQDRYEANRCRLSAIQHGRAKQKPARRSYYGET